MTPNVRLFRSAKEVEAAFEELNAALHTLDFEVDGLVFKINDFEQREQLGDNQQKPALDRCLQVRKVRSGNAAQEIRVQIGKTGTVTPVAELELFN